MVRSLPRRLGVLGLALAVLAWPALLRAQARPTLADLALLWIQGDYRAPIVCEIAGSAHVALRRVRITEGPRRVTRPTARVIFFDLEAPPDTQCTDPTGGEEPNVVGQLVLAFESGHAVRSDTADYDFRSALRREGGFEFEIKAGRLRVGPPDGELVEHDLGGGTARVTTIRRGSDGFRHLAEFGPRRKLRLEVEAEGAPTLAFDLVQTDG